jgi:alpha-tubulin suppressor-like RCC1 family protein
MQPDIELPLIYPEIQSDLKNKHSNVLLIDRDSIKDYNVFVGSVNSDTFPIVYSWRSSSEKLLFLLRTLFTTIPRIAVVFSSIENIPSIFLDETQLFAVDETEPFSKNVQFIIQVIREFRVKNVDFLACNTLNSTAWRQYYDTLHQQTGVVVGASDNKTGNIKYGGDWVMESTSQDIESIYFTKNIEYYSYLLDGMYYYSSFCVTPDGVYATGCNQSGELGTTEYFGSNTGGNYVKMQIPPGKQVSGISGSAVSTNAYGSHTVVLMTDGSVYATGFSGYGQIADSSIVYASSQDYFSTRGNLINISLPDNKKATFVCAGYGATFIVTEDGNAYATGYNPAGCFGTTQNLDAFTRGTLVQMNVPTGKKVASVSSFCYFFTLVLMTDGTVYGAGSNSGGVIGTSFLNSNTAGALVSINLPAGKTAFSVHTGFDYSIILMTDGTVYGTGSNRGGQLGTTRFLSTATNGVLVPMLLPPNKTAVSVTTGYENVFVLMNDGTVYCAGFNSGSQFGAYINTVYTKNGGLFQFPLPDNTTAIQVSCAHESTIVLLNNKTAIGAGNNVYGQLGNTSYYGGYTNGNLVTSSISGIIDTLGKIIVYPPPPPYPCFKQGSKIITFKGYKKVEDLRTGDLVKTLRDGFKPIAMIGKRDIKHLASKSRVKDQLYKCTRLEYPELTEDLVLTGSHSILVDAFVSEEQREKTIEVLKHVYATDGKYRLPACADPRASVYEKPGTYTIYHLALENDDYYMNYGIYANGLLVESCSKRYLKEESNMELI